MRSNMKLGDVISAVVEKSQALSGRLSVKSIWDWECWRDGKLLWKEKTTNIVPNEGLNAILNIMFHASTQITTWYVAIFENDYTPLATNTYAAPGYTECITYDEATRPAYVEAAASGQSITNSASRAAFTINASKTIYGGSLVGGGTGATTKGDAAGGGTLFCSSKFAIAKPVVATDVLKVTITIAASEV